MWGVQVPHQLKMVCVPYCGVLFPFSSVPLAFTLIHLYLITFSTDLTTFTLHTHALEIISQSLSLIIQAIFFFRIRTFFSDMPLLFICLEHDLSKWHFSTSHLFLLLKHLSLVIPTMYIHWIVIKLFLKTIINNQPLSFYLFKLVALICYVAQSGLRFLPILLPQPPKCLDYIENTTHQSKQKFY